MSDARLRGVLRVILWFNRKAKALSVRLVRWTGKSPEWVHPKHLLGADHPAYWYLPYVSGRVLDVGCGNGGHTLRVAQLADRVMGIDRDGRSLGVLSRNASRLGLGNVGLWKANVDVEEPLAFLPSASFDTALCLDLLEHVHNRNGLLREIGRVLMPNGRLLLAVPQRATTWKSRLDRAGLPSFSDPDHKVEYTLGELSAELAAGGFAIRCRCPAVYDTPWIGMVDVIGGLSLTAYRALTRWRIQLGDLYPEEQAGFYLVCGRAP